MALYHSSVSRVCSVLVTDVRTSFPLDWGTASVQSSQDRSLAELRFLLPVATPHPYRLPQTSTYCLFSLLHALFCPLVGQPLTETTCLLEPQPNGCWLLQCATGQGRFGPSWRIVGSTACSLGLWVPPNLFILPKTNPQLWEL